MINTIGQKLNFLNDGSILSVGTMTDSIGINPSPIMPSQM
jgi:hypothetical protein